MARKLRKIETVKQYFKLKECKKGQVLVKEGEYLGSVPKQGKYQGENYDFREVATGVVKSLSGGGLGYALQSVEVGAICKVTYQGMAKVKGGKFAGTSAHDFTLEVYEDEASDDQDETEEEEEIEEVDAEDETEEEADEEEESEEEEEAEEEDEEDEEEDVIPVKDLKKKKLKTKTAPSKGTLTAKDVKKKKKKLSLKDMED